MPIQPSLHTTTYISKWSTKADFADGDFEKLGFQVGSEFQFGGVENLVSPYLDGALVYEKSLSDSFVDSVGLKGEGGACLRLNNWLNFKTGLYEEGGWVLGSGGDDYPKGYFGLGSFFKMESIFNPRNKKWSFFANIFSQLGLRNYSVDLSDNYMGSFGGFKGWDLGAGLAFGIKLKPQIMPRFEVENVASNHQTQNQISSETKKPVLNSETQNQTGNFQTQVSDLKDSTHLKSEKNGILKNPNENPDVKKIILKAEPGVWIDESQFSRNLTGATYIKNLESVISMLTGYDTAAFSRMMPHIEESSIQYKNGVLSYSTLTDGKRICYSLKSKKENLNDGSIKISYFNSENQPTPKLKSVSLENHFGYWILKPAPDFKDYQYPVYYVEWHGEGQFNFGKGAVKLANQAAVKALYTSGQLQAMADQSTEIGFRKALSEMKSLG